MVVMDLEGCELERVFVEFLVYERYGKNSEHIMCYLLNRYCCLGNSSSFINITLLLL